MSTRPPIPSPLDECRSAFEEHFSVERNEKGFYPETSERLMWLACKFGFEMAARAIPTPDSGLVERFKQAMEVEGYERGSRGMRDAVDCLERTLRQHPSPDRDGLIEKLEAEKTGEGALGDLYNKGITRAIAIIKGENA